ncbi:MAG TPA: hypothetical protein VK616_16810, partial [Flavitalea sp.]|nr:hypothetical protein [Flavitalea sp.]
RNASASCTYFCQEAPRDVHDILDHHDFSFDLRYRKALIDKGIYLIPIACKQSSVSHAHTEEDIYHTISITKQVLDKL